MNATSVGLLFPGQGSQHVGMGQDLATRFPEARRLWEEADDVLDFRLSRLCWEGPLEELTRTVHAQPAILVHSLAAWRLLQERVEANVIAAAGHSLGEFSAYAAAGSLLFRDAVRSVRRRGELMSRAGDARAGTMAAVIGLGDAAVAGVCREASSATAVVVPANFNAPGQVVISGDEAGVARAAELLRAAGAKRVLPLTVSGAFHSPLMADAESGLRDQLAGVEFASPRFPVISNVTAAPVREPSDARALLLEQLTAPVRWVASMRAMANAGVANFLEIGPGNVLTGLLRRIDRSARGISLGTADALDRVLEEEVTSWS